MDLATAFSVLAILRVVEGPLNILLYACPALASSLACFSRIQKYLLAQSRQDNRLSLESVYDSEEYWSSQQTSAEGIELQRLSVSRTSANEVLLLKNCSFGWEPTHEVIHDVDLSIKAGGLTMIIGPVACGKSTLIKGILGECTESSGFVYLRDDSIAFADQDPWVQNGTIKAAICGPTSWGVSPGDDLWYQEVIACCGLTEDIKNFSRGDQTRVGSKGVCDTLNFA
jgi:ATP-binding cassette, subfamily C (CFTR/MRP), member 1